MSDEQREQQAQREEHALRELLSAIVKLEHARQRLQGRARQYTTLDYLADARRHIDTAETLLTWTVS